MSRLAAALALCLCLPAGAQAGDVSVAVASNFTAPMQKIAAAFERDSGHKVTLSSGATGKFYAQIHNGAPFQLLLAADSDTPHKLEQEGRAVAGTRFTYAIGRLALWSPRADLVDGRPDVLRGSAFTHLAIANPKLAPYGAASMEVLGKLGLASALAPKIVQGENIAQTWQFVASGNAQLGFVALSQIMADGRLGAGSAWLVPPSMHAPIKQDAVLLEAGRSNGAAQELLRYLRGDKARAVSRDHGYAF